jgi:diadenosine tetraphosphatase ApaH/serine/threonine PP2A family protein phosphatase
MKASTYQKICESAEPIYVRKRTVMARTGLSKFTIEELLRRGLLRGKKFGSATLIDWPHALAFFDSLPDAVFAESRGGARPPHWRLVIHHENLRRKRPRGRRGRVRRFVKFGD